MEVKVTHSDAVPALFDALELVPKSTFQRCIGMRPARVAKALLEGKVPAYFEEMSRNRHTAKQWAEDMVVFCAPIVALAPIFDYKGVVAGMFIGLFFLGTISRWRYYYKILTVLRRRGGISGPKEG